MNNLTHFIRNTIEKDAVIRQGLSRGLITPRALSSFIVKSNPSEGLSPEAVRTCIRRNKKEFFDLNEAQANTDNVFKDSRLHFKSGIARVAFHKGDASLELINETFKSMGINAGDTFRITKGYKILHIIIDEENLDRMKDIFSERLLNVEPGLCEMIIELPEIGKMTYGIYAAIINEIALNRINIVEAFSCGTEINVFVAEKDSQKAFNVLKDMLERAKKEGRKAKK